MNRTCFVLFALVAACDCGKSHSVDAAPVDVRLDDVRDDDAETLPPVEPEGATCEDLDTRNGQICIERGWFVLPQWSPLELDSVTAGYVRRVAYLDTFQIDETEVTNAEFALWASSEGIPLPSCGGATELLNCMTCEGPRDFEMTSPFDDAGTVADGFADHPVACVSRSDAEQFCEAQGGRLPTVYEWFKSAVGDYPNIANFPWGEETDSDRIRPNPIGFPPPPLPNTSPVGQFPLGGSPYGVLDMSGGVSELVEGCPSVDGQIGTEPLIRPQPTVCDDSLIAGTNWLSTSGAVGEPWVSSLTFGLFSLTDNGAVQYLGDYDSHILLDTNVMGYNVRDAEEGRTWRVGFRCAYDP